MKKRRLFLVSLVCCALASSAVSSWAHDDDDDRDDNRKHSNRWDHDDDDRDRDDDDRHRHHSDRDDDDDDDDDRDRHHGRNKHEKHRFRGIINLDHGLILTPTTNAPAGAKGTARFIVVNDKGTNYEMLFVKTVNLTNSVYTVEVTDDTGTNVFSLGSLNVVTKTNIDRGHPFSRYCPPWGGLTNGPSSGYSRWIRELARKKAHWGKLIRLSASTNLFAFATNAYCWHTNTLNVGSGSFLLPEGLSHSNSTIITVSDSTNVVLTGDFSTVTNATVIYKEIAEIIPGTATNAQGTATITYRLARNKAVGTFKLEATGLPPKEKLYLTADGTNTIKAHTGRQGALTVRSFRRLDFANVQSIVATDKSSNVVFSVSF
jgi:hypothetical protein